MKNYNTWGVPWQPVVQPHLDVYHRQGRLGRHGVGHPHQELQHMRAERPGAVWASLIITISAKVPNNFLPAAGKGLRVNFFMTFVAEVSMANVKRRLRLVAGLDFLPYKL